MIRVPLRLGFDVFENGLISDEKTTMLIQTLKAFRHLINAYEVDAIKACAGRDCRTFERETRRRGRSADALELGQA